MTSILVINPIALMLSMAHSVVAISLIVGTWHAIGYLWAIFVRHLTSQKCCEVRGSEGLSSFNIVG